MCIGMSVDTFAVALGKGLSLRKVTIRDILIVGLWFGVANALMPIVGWIAGSTISDVVTRYRHWIFFAIMMILGIMLLREAFTVKEEEEVDADLSYRTMLPLSIAISIDSMAAGVCFSAGNTGMFEGSFTLGSFAFLASVIGVYLGAHFGTRFGKIATVCGALLLILNGFLALAEGLNVLQF